MRKLFSRNAHDWTEKLPGRRGGGWAASRRSGDARRRGGRAAARRHQQLSGAAERRLEHRTRPARVHGLRSAPPRRSRPHRRAPRGPQGGARSPARLGQRQAPPCCATAITSSARAPSSSRRRASSAWKGSCRRGATRPTAARAAPTGSRSSASSEQEIVIGGYTEPEGSRIGHRRAARRGLRRRPAACTPARSGPDSTTDPARSAAASVRARAEDEPVRRAAGRRGARALGEAELVAQVSFSEWTSDGRLRHPAFQGLREDKPADSVVRERPAAADDEVKETSTPTPKRAARGASARFGRRRPPARRPSPACGSRTRDRVLYPPQGITKLDLARFYESIAEVDPPAPRGPPDDPRALSRRRGQGRASTRSTSATGRRRACDGSRSRRSARSANIWWSTRWRRSSAWSRSGILEIHTWNSVVKRLERPDRVVFDLDPGARCRVGAGHRGRPTHP